jgi:magnesium chelatase subunit I
MKEFPFTAIVGMQDAKRSLIYHGIDPKIGGSLLLGHRGCAKTTLARAFAKVLQATSDQTVPFVELPLGATEDRLLGSLSAEALVEQNRWETRIGLIEEANGGVLYVDEINLLPDHLADQLLDSAASGKHHLERDGITRRIESRYVLIGTMNPDEGDLRPQILDRFAHGIIVRDELTPDQRVEVVRRRIQFDDDPDEFIELHAASLAEVAKRLVSARTLVKRVTVSEQQRHEIADQARRLQLEGLRAEVAVMRTARCAAAWENRLAIAQQDLEEAWRMCLGHRKAEHRGPTSLSSPPPPGRKFNPPPAQRTSLAPINSLPDPKPLPEPRVSSHQTLRDWAGNHFTRTQGLEPTLGFGTAGGARRGTINWIATLLNSVLAGKISGRSEGEPSDVLTPSEERSHVLAPHGERKIRLTYHSVRQRPRVWCFLDASRSTGMSRCLSAARDSLIDLAAHFRSRRWDLLVLRNNQIKWITKKGSYHSFTNALAQVNSACGKSYLFKSFHYLHRAILQEGSTVQDRLIIVSDGLASLEPGQAHRDTPSRLRHYLRRIARIGVSIAWLYPSHERALARWLQRILGGLPVTSIKL